MIPIQIEDVDDFNKPDTIKFQHNKNILKLMHSCVAVKVAFGSICTVVLLNYTKKDSHANYVISREQQ